MHGLNNLLSAASGPNQHWINHGKATRQWLTVTPSHCNNTGLSKLQFQDGLCLRCGITPSHLPKQCDACNVPFTVAHALQCKKGNLVSLRHDDIKLVWEELLGEALQPSAVRDEPPIHIGRPAPDATAPPPDTPDPANRGDIAAHGFWQTGIETVFDVSLIDTDSPSYLSQAPTKLVENREQQKWLKHGPALQEQRRHFTPLVYTVDGMVGKEARVAMQRLSRHLSLKWHRDYSRCCGYVSGRLAIALVRGASMCLRNSRLYRSRVRTVDWRQGCIIDLL